MEYNFFHILGKIYFEFTFLSNFAFIAGTSSLTGKFFASCVVLSSHEDTRAWSEIYQYVHDLGVKPAYHMGDGAKAISKAGREVFGDLE